jgi:hypothetical protein
LKMKPQAFPRSLRHLSRAIGLAALLLVAACAQIAPTYVFSPEHIEALKKSGPSSVRLGAFTAAERSSGAARLTVRSVTLTSPYGDYPAYLKEALRQELTEAGKLGANAEIEITGVMTNNDLDASGFVVGDGELTARIVVRRGGAALFDKPVTAKSTWDSSFVGAIAIPRAITEYPKLVSAFIAALLRDPDFLAAIK